VDIAEAVALTNRIYARLVGRRPAVNLAEDYYEGRQPLNYATEEWRKANAARYSGFSDNWCGTVVNAEAERLKPIGISMTGGKRDALRLWDTLQTNEFDAQFSQGVVASLAMSRSYIIIWGDRAGEPVVSVEHPSFVEIEYDFENPRRRLAALKTWVDDKLEYATLYTPDALWKFQRGRATQKDEHASQAEQGRDDSTWEGGWVPREFTGDDSWPVPNKLGEVPVVEVANRPTLKGDPISEIAGVMPMQDAINLLWNYMFLSADYASMKARVVTGSDAPKVPILADDGTVAGYRPLDLKDFAEKRIAFLPGEAKIDQWDAADLKVFTDVIEIAVGHIATQTRTPQHYLVSNSERPAAAFEAQEAGLVKKANEFITFTDPALREVLRLCALVRGEVELAQRCRLATIVWANPAIRSESQLADALQKKRKLGYPLREILALDGKSPTDITRILKHVDEERAQTGAEESSNVAPADPAKPGVAQ
jgi:hypothetical protein